MTSSSEKREAKARMARTGETYTAALHRNRDISRYVNLLIDITTTEGRIKEGCWRHPDFQRVTKWMFDRRDACVKGTIDSRERIELARALPEMFGDETIRFNASLEAMTEEERVALACEMNAKIQAMGPPPDEWYVPPSAS